MQTVSVKRINVCHIVKMPLLSPFCIYSIMFCNKQFQGVYCILKYTTIKNSKRKECFLHGEFNVDWLKNDKHAGTNEFLDSISSYMFLQYIFHPTSATGYSQTITDNIFSNYIFNIGNMQ